MTQIDTGASSAVPTHTDTGASSRPSTPITPTASPPRWLLRQGRELVLDRPLVMGIVNVTPDSFSDGGRLGRAAIDHARRLVEAGADLLDVGGESTRPGAPEVPLDEELRRVMPVVEAIAAWPAAERVPVSVDTRRPEVMRAVLAAGADAINDIEALRVPGAIEVVSATDCGIVLMHMQGQPRTMQQAPRYDDVLAEVAGFLAERLDACERAGIARQRLLLDPGFGFGKTLDHNLDLLAGLEALASLGVPVLAGLSRKSMIGALTGRSIPGERMAGSVAAALLAAQRGASVLRVHDVAQTVDALRVWMAVACRNPLSVTGQGHWSMAGR